MRRLAPVTLLVVAGVALWASGLTRLVSWDSLARHAAALAEWVGQHPWQAAATYLLTYVASAALSLPVAGMLTITGGWLFGPVLGTVLAASGATAGASLLFLTARPVLGDRWIERGGQRASAMRARLQRDGFSYLLAIRLVPLFPFWLVNLAAALGGIRLAAFVAATALGVLPVSAVFAWTGSGIGGVLAAGGRPDMGVIFSLPVLGPLALLAALSLTPVLVRQWNADA